MLSKLQGHYQIQQSIFGAEIAGGEKECVCLTWFVFILVSWFIKYSAYFQDIEE